MDAKNMRKAANDERYRSLIDLIFDRALDGFDNVSVAPMWVAGIKTRLRKAGYTLLKWSGRLDDWEGNWVMISWEGKENSK